ncbi:hypothetical protein Misp01_35190 [Microtetraspora sp. NBRC 13810]|uniref:PH domain-containing protein n=1 Tax=Microtetraspora sp. NBRC 13810 TaxID=3030990 RepID=UPI0024A2875A|nr:PH domain-containing protein [Microtetraspora sp. NBRC 13810]GLW08389.1 hypothetical protein Misp01_35190 [Microtetraspora sp. NBRC 13810]
MSGGLGGREWRVQQKLVVVKAVGLVAALALTALSLDDRRAVVLCGAAALVLAALLVRDLLVPVRLAADEDGLVVINGFAGRKRIAWSDVERVKVDVFHRYGRRWEHMEIDTGTGIHVLGSASLGTSCTEVAAELRSMRAAYGMPGGVQGGESGA